MKMPIKSFKLKALFFMIPTLVVVSLVFTFDSIRTEKEIIRSEIIKRAETVTSLATKTGELPILSGNPELMKETASFLRANSEVSSVTFYDAKRVMLINDGERVAKPVPALSPQKPMFMYEEENSFVFYAPVYTVRTSEDIDIFQEPAKARQVRETIGWIRLGFSKNSMKENERKIVIRGLSLALFFVTGGSLLIFVLISFATRPLASIAKIAKDISNGDFRQGIEIGHEDEIGVLAKSFQSMKKTIEQVLRDTNELIVSVRAGKLDSRTEAGRFQGRWRDLVNGVNDLSAAFMKANADLQAAKDEAESANRAKSNFLSNMSHELRTPLNAVLGYAQILLRDGKLSEKQRQQVEIILSSGDHLLTLISDLLDVSKIEAGKMNIEDVPFDLPALMRQVFSLTKLQAEEKGLSFFYEPDASLPSFVAGDERKLKQVLLNLLSNAVKYTDKGSISLRACYGRSETGVFRCEVEDTGVGIPAEKLDLIFEPFTQLDEGGQSAGGTGLGLHITRALVFMMQGKMGVESSLASGSLFWVELPLPTVPENISVKQKAQHPVTGYQGARKRILAVDDNVTNISMLLAVLEAVEFEVAAASDGKEALDRMRDFRPDLVLLDLVIPGLDGLETAKVIRQTLPAAKIIGISATAGTRTGEFSAVCDDLLVKPIDLDSLFEKIRLHLDLEWTMSPVDEKKHAPIENDIGGDFTAPPPEELHELYTLARMGDMRGIRAWAENLEAVNETYKAFSSTLRKLAVSYKTKALLALVERHMGKNV